MTTTHTFDGLTPRERDWLDEIGITSTIDLRVIGAATAYEMIREVHPEATPDLLARLRRAARG